MPERKHEPDGNRAFAFLHELAGHIVDGRNMVSIHRMAKAETVGKKGGAQQYREMTEGQDRPEPRRSIEYDQDQYKECSADFRRHHFPRRLFRSPHALGRG